MGSSLNLTINNGEILAKDITGLAKYTEYEFQVSAFTSVGDGPKSTVNFVRTKEDGKKSIIMITNFYWCVSFND